MQYVLTVTADGFMCKCNDCDHVRMCALTHWKYDENLAPDQEIEGKTRHPSGACLGAAFSGKQ
jgi:hypothetical protein